MSAKTARAPTYSAQLADVIQVNAGTITSSPGPRPRANQAVPQRRRTRGCCERVARVPLGEGPLERLGSLGPV